MPARVALVEDQPATRTRIAKLLRQMPQLRLEHMYSSAEEVLHDLPLSQVDLILVDIVLPGMSGIDLVRMLRSRRVDLIILILTAYDDPERIFESLANGADGYLLKSHSPEQLKSRIAEAFEGGSVLSGTIARKIIQHFLQPSEVPREIEQLTTRELTILREIAKGHTYKETGSFLGIEAETVRAHVRNIKAKLQVGTRTQAVAKLVQNQAWLRDSPPRPSTADTRRTTRFRE